MTVLLFLLALAPATLLAYTVSPSATVLNQLASIGGWGAVLLLSPRLAATSDRRPWALAAALLVCAAAGLFSWRALGVPASLALTPVLVLLVALVVATAGVASAARDTDGRPMAALGACLAMIGVANVLIALVQVFAPDSADGAVLARSGLVGRAVGNLRQPNHLSSIALWSAVALVPLMESGRLARWVSAPLFALFIFSVELSASRTGAIGVLVIAIWGLLDRRLSRATRLTLLLAPIVYATGWAAMSAWAAESHHTFGAAARLGESDVSGSRFGIWSNALALIRAFPLFGVGFGEFNYAWTLTPFPGRPTAFFDHTHNIVLELLVELGWPLGGLVIVLLGVALWQAGRRSLAVPGERGVGFRSAFVMVLLMAIHSQLEYPLWYAYFLLPTAWAWGYCLGAAPAGGTAPAEAAPSRAGRAFFALAGVLMIAGSAWAFSQYLTVSRIFDPADDARPLDERIADGRRSLFFGHHADYAAATVAEHPSQAWASFRTAPHYLLDSRLMIAWATAFAERGDLDHARYIAQRLREFRKPEAAEFFAPCDQQPAPQPLPFQCEPPSRAIDWREFRDPALYR